MNYTEAFPVLSKWVTIRNESQKPIQLDALSCEILAVNEQEKHRLHVESDYAFSGIETTQWGPDADYKDASRLSLSDATVDDK